MATRKRFVKIQELIECLTEFKNTYGNVEVVFFKNNTINDYSIRRLEFDQNKRQLEVYLD